jgi:hypothetical protein
MWKSRDCGGDICGAARGGASSNLSELGRHTEDLWASLRLCSSLGSTAAAFQVASGTCQLVYP